MAELDIVEEEYRLAHPTKTDPAPEPPVEWPSLDSTIIFFGIGVVAIVLDGAMYFQYRPDGVTGFELIMLMFVGVVTLGEWSMFVYYVLSYFGNLSKAQTAEIVKALKQR